MLAFLVALSLAQTPVNPIRPVDLQRVDNSPVTVEPKNYKLKPGQVKAFASGPSTKWLFSPVSQDATKSGLVLEDAEAGALVFAFDVDAGRFGRFKVPEPVVLVACNQGAKGTYRLDKIEATVKEVDGKQVVDIKIVDQTYLIADGGEVKPPEPEPKPDDKPKPVKVDKLRLIVVRDPLNMPADAAVLLGDTPFWKTFVDRGHFVRFYSLDDEEGKPYSADAPGVSPVLLVYDNANTGKPLKVFKLPVAKSELEAFVKEVSK